MNKIRVKRSDGFIFRTLSKAAMDAECSQATLRFKMAKFGKFARADGVYYTTDAPAPAVIGKCGRECFSQYERGCRPSERIAPQPTQNPTPMPFANINEAGAITIREAVTELMKVGQYKIARRLIYLLEKE